MGTTQSNETLLCNEPRDDGVRYFSRFENRPFAYGACRYAYKGTLACVQSSRHKARYNGSSIVVKVFKKGLAKDYGAWNADVSASKEAHEYATLFNAKRFIERSLYFPIPYVAKMDKRAGSWFLGFIGGEDDMSTNPVGSMEYVAMEEYISGNYIKFNSNNGYVNDAVNSSTMPAFSHWTFHHSNGELLVCDLQGVLNGKNYRLTDPAIHSTTAKRYGLTDLGIAGQASFFKTHKCNNICRRWKKIRLTNELNQEVNKIQSSAHTTFSFQVPNIKTNKSQFNYIPIIEE
ncbi:unnamed protein product [Adineta steineri]|uniref:Alpha-type protein kinase domain-containing protein n=1 Tax=Adineta steineri TaxID=433720 RepID=A0A819AEP2_9BILA|nr:unnamed protein product [Adineta steineri]CAF3784513.1 unnamed protein product [Adineta steineri]